MAPGPLADRWADIVRHLIDSGAVQALARELALQSGLVEVIESHEPRTWKLIVEREALRAPAQRDKLAQALAAHLGQPVQIELIAGVPEDTFAQRLVAEKARQQAEAEATIHGDPVVRELLGQFKTARVVPGSIQALATPGAYNLSSNEEGQKS